jgi:hypothetical protein
MSCLGYCKNCKFWKHHENDYGKKWNSCEVAGWGERGDKFSSDALAIFVHVHDDSGLEAGLMTGPEFGCIKFQEAGR